MRINKMAAAVAVAAVAVTGTGVAYAYWTTQGTGTGSASSTADGVADKIDIDQTSSNTGFYPGATAQNVTVTATNPASFSQRVGEVTFTVADSGADGPDTGTEGDCTSDNWTVSNTADDIGVLTAGAVSASTVVGTVALRESGANQDACKNVTPVLTFSSAAGE